jgi:3D (Asp-Asp-Asp) domain-containing protein
LLGALLAVGGLVPATVSADSASSLRQHASQLARENANLAARSRGVVLQLYSLDSQLAREQARLVQLRIRTAQVRGELATARKDLRLARRSLSIEERALASRLQLLYEQGDADPVAIVLGASSVADALGSLDSLNRIADQDRLVIEQARAAKHTAQKLERSLSAKEHDLVRLSREATESTLVLEQARAQRRAYLGQLASQQRLNTAAISSYQQQALAVEATARQVSAQQASAVSPTSVAPGGSTMTVVATGYSGQGNTASGAPAGWGMVAVDPSVIPLGTGITIPGYGSGVAADTGGAIQGATIDLWFPTDAQALAWGRRTVTISLH